MFLLQYLFLQYIYISGVFRSLNECNRIQTHSHLVRKQTLNHVAKLASLA